MSPLPAPADWAGFIADAASTSATDDPANGGIRREPELPEHEEIAAEQPTPIHEFEPLEEETDDEAQRSRLFQRDMRTIARQASLDPADDMSM